MAPAKNDPRREKIRATATDLLGAVTKLQMELSELILKLGPADQTDVRAAEQGWKRLRRRRSVFDGLFTELSDALEDWSDAEEAEAALAEPGESIAWEDLKAELGHS